MVPSSDEGISKLDCNSTFEDQVLFRILIFTPNIMDHSPIDVAVIGAGISGVVTAGHLLAAGINVTVFERSHAAGGVW